MITDDKTFLQRHAPNDPASWGFDDEWSKDVGGFKILLRRYRARTQRNGAVLLIHGASASSDTFLVPNGGLVRYLGGAGWEVWTLDWRGSCRVVGSLPADGYLPKVKVPDPRAAVPEVRDAPREKGTLATECSLFTVDAVAEEDIPWAVQQIRETLDGETSERVPMAVLGHCFGSGALAVSVARGRIEHCGVESVVFSTLALFYEVTWNGWVKAEDFVIERTMAEVAKKPGDPLFRAVDPRPTPGSRSKEGNEVGWPDSMAEAYAAWPPQWLPSGTKDGDKIFKRLTFMFGQPYLREHLVPTLHDAMLPRLFGGMHLGLYLHAGQMVRRGYAAKLDALDVIDRSRLAARKAAVARAAGDLRPQFFMNKAITLFTGAQNQLWHRDSVDLMHEWLLANWLERGRPSALPVKRVFDKAAHQDLLWSKDAAEEAERGFGKGGKLGVYRFIADTLNAPSLAGKGTSALHLAGT